MSKADASDDGAGAVLVTRVGHAGHGHNHFMGFDVAEDLAGSFDIWSTLAIAVGFRPLDPAEAGVLDDVAVCALASDPRIWPLKLVRVASAYGSRSAALAAFSVACDHALIGPSISGDAAEFLATFAAVDLEVLPRMVGERLAKYVLPPPGFGVPFRDVDERVVALEHCLERRGRSSMPTWTRLRAVERIVIEARGAPVNIGGAVAAALLDVGLSPEHIRALPLALPGVLANAVEGARQAPEVLRRLPDDMLEYRGPAPRKSPRAT